MKSKKRTILAITLELIMIFVLTACNIRNSTNTTFPNIDNTNIPDILKMTVGTLGDTYFTSFGKSDNKDYQSFLAVTFEKTTKADYSALMTHYESTSIGVDESGCLLFYWGRLHVDYTNDSICINAYIK